MLTESTKIDERKKTKKNRWDICSLFAGCGGLDLGFKGGFNYRDQEFEELGFSIKGAYEFDSKAVQTYGMNIGDHIHEVDLSNFEPSEMPDHQVLIGGFPCQDFSSCGPKRGLSSERGQLYKAFIKVMKEFNPEVVVAENVPHLLSMQNGTVVETIIRDLESVGYKFDKWLLYAPHYGVPQNRKRVFLIGVRNDLFEKYGFPQVPIQSHPFQFNSIDWAIADLEHVEDNETVPNQGQYFRASRAKNGNGQGDEVNRAGEPSYTVRANAKSRVQYHYRLNRRLTVRECARLQTFPDNFIFPHSATKNIMEIGNAVPPILAHSVARSIANYLENLN